VLFSRINPIDDAIDEYEVQLKETVDRGRASNDGKDEFAYVKRYAPTSRNLSRC